MKAEQAMTQGWAWFHQQLPCRQCQYTHSTASEQGLAQKVPHALALEEATGIYNFLQCTQDFKNTTLSGLQVVSPKDGGGNSSASHCIILNFTLLSCNFCWEWLLWAFWSCCTSESDYQNFAKNFFALFFSFASKHLRSASQCTSTLWGLTF